MSVASSHGDEGVMLFFYRMAGFIDAMLVNDEVKDIFQSRRKVHGGIPIHT